ncbi:MAG: hypothetical protein HC854_14380 [Flavobacterium sp.]|nr:hypothetical protein [Flavobacterium sp.]
MEVSVQINFNKLDILIFKESCKKFFCGYVIQEKKRQNNNNEYFGKVTGFPNNLMKLTYSLGLINIKFQIE